MNNFCLKFRFSQAQHAVSDFCFSKTGVSSMRLVFYFVFISPHSETLFKKIFRKKFLNFLFFLKFSVKKDGFFAVSCWGRMVLQIYAYPFGYFWRCKIDEILTIISFYPWCSPYDIGYLVFFRSSQLNMFAKHGFASVLKWRSIVVSEAFG